jgi:hypothetical protein
LHFHLDPFTVMIIMRLKVSAFKANHALVVLLQGKPCSVEYGGPLFPLLSSNEAHCFIYDSQLLQHR